MNFQNVTFKQLRAFVVVAEERSFARAASRLNLTPPALTHAIKTLERVIGLRLFDRSTRSVHPTAQASEFLPIAQRLVQDLSDALDLLNGKASASSGSVVVTGATSFMAYMLTPAVTQLASLHPGVRVRVVGSATAEVTRSVLEGEADFGVTTLAPAHHVVRTHELDSTPLLSDRMGVVYHRDHPFARHDGPITTKVLASQRFVSLNRLNGVRLLIDADRRLPDACRRPLYEVSEVPLLAPMLEHRVGIALLPAMAARPIVGGQLRFRPLHASIWRRLHLVSRHGRTLSPAAKLLVQFILRELHGARADPWVSIAQEATELS